MTERENAASKGGAVKQEKIVACLRKEARARAIERRDFAIELDALADIYDWK